MEIRYWTAESTYLFTEPNDSASNGLRGLLEYNDDGTITPKLAEKWDVSEDKTVYTFHLRQDVKYSDGTAFNADNVMKNFDAILANKDRHSWGL